VHALLESGSLRIMADGLQFARPNSGKSGDRRLMIYGRMFCEVCDHHSQTKRHRQSKAQLLGGTLDRP
jgi:hypothetical protein